MMTTASYDDEYRSIVALNSIGVSLLERGSFRHAMSAFKDAMQGMKAIFNPEALGFLPSTQSIDILRKLRRCRERLSKIHVQTVRPSPSQSFRSNVLSYIDTLLDRSLVQSMEQRGREDDDFNVFSIRIEGMNCCAPLSDRREAEFQASIILYNFGMSQLCLSMAAANDDAAKAEMWRQGALRTFSRNLLLSKYVLSGSEEDVVASVHDNDFRERVSLLLIMVVNALHRLAPEPEGAFQERLRKLWETLHDSLHRCPVLASVSVCAAAAA